MNPLQELIQRRLDELGISQRAACAKSRGLLTVSTLNRIIKGHHTQITQNTIGGLAFALSVLPEEVEAAAEATARPSQWVALTGKFGNLSPERQQQAMDFIQDLLSAEETGRRAALIPCIAYLRVSKGREEMISPDIQRTMINSWAQANGREIVLWLEDLNSSGRDFAKRKIDAGIQAIADGVAGEVVVYRYDRWGRNALQSQANCYRVENELGGKVFSATEPYDTGTAHGKYSRSNAFNMAELQSDIIGENWRATFAYREDQGLPPHGGPRFGYDWTSRKDGGDGFYYVNPQTGPVLAEMYRRIIAGQKQATVRAWLNTTGHTPPRRTRNQKTAWEDRDVYAVLDSGFGAGLIVKGVTTAERTYLKGKHDAVIDQATWEAYCALRTTMRKAPAAKRKAHYVMTSLMFCGYCGGPVTLNSSDESVPGVRGGRRRVAGWRPGCVRHKKYNDCHTFQGTNRSHVEAAVRSWLEDELSREGALWQRRVAAGRKAQTTRTNVDALIEERKKVARSLAKLVDGWANDLVDDESYKALRPAKEARLREIDDAIATASRKPVAPKPEVFAAALQAWDTLDVPEANAALRAIIAKVVLTDRDHIKVIGRWEVEDE